MEGNLSANTFFSKASLRVCASRPTAKPPHPKLNTVEAHLEKTVTDQSLDRVRAIPSADMAGCQNERQRRRPDRQLRTKKCALAEVILAKSPQPNGVASEKIVAIDAGVLKIRPRSHPLTMHAKLN